MNKYKFLEPVRVFNNFIAFVTGSETMIGGLSGSKILTYSVVSCFDRKKNILAFTIQLFWQNFGKSLEKI